MRTAHPLMTLAPYFALTAFGATAALGLQRGAGGVGLVVRCILAFYLTYYFVRLCGSLLAALGAGRPEPPVAESPGPTGGSD